MRRSTDKRTNTQPSRLRRIASSIALHLMLAAAFAFIFVTAFCGWPF